MQTYRLQNSKGLFIVGDLTQPKGGIRGTCVLQHGWSGTRKHTTVQAIQEGFLQGGFQVFNFDTTHSFGESDGDFEQSTLGLHTEDLFDVVEWVRDQDWHQGKLALAGHSKGGYAVCAYAEEHPDEIDYIVAVAPVISGELSFEVHKKRDRNAFENWQKTGLVEQISRSGYVKRKHWFQMEERLNHDLMKNIHQLTMPLHIIVGSEDNSCPVEHQAIFYNALPHQENKKLSIIEGAPHSFYEKDEMRQCSDIILKWLTEK